VTANFQDPDGVKTGKAGLDQGPQCTWFVVGFWTIAACFSLVWNVAQDNFQMKEVALVEARSHFNKEVAFRRWIASHGGVYVPVDDRTPPDEELAYLPDRDIPKPSGDMLTLVHPVYGARQINDYFNEANDVTSKTVSLHPLDPEDTPDAWEKAALEAFESGEREVTELVQKEGESYLRLIRPVFSEAICMKCHSGAGSQIGEILGGVTVTVPFAPRQLPRAKHFAREVAAHMLLWVLGLVGIQFGAQRFRTWFRYRERAEEELREREILFRGLSEQSPNMIFITLHGAVVYANQKFKKIMGLSQKEVELQHVNLMDLVASDSRSRVGEHFRTILGGSEDEPFECTLFPGHGERIDVLMAVIPIHYKGKRAILGTITDITNRKEMESQITASLREKEVLLQEIHHRVKNNLQVISSLLSLQADTVTNPAVLEVFKDSERRIRSMAAVHEQLYRSGNLAFIDSAEYIRSVVEDVYSSYNCNAHIELQTDLESIPMAPDKAIPCGLIINELVSNALKHAFPEGCTGRLTVTLQRTGDPGRSGPDCVLSVCDDGLGLPADTDVRKTESLGLQLVTSLCERQLRGTLEVERDGGTCFRLRFNAQ